MGGVSIRNRSKTFHQIEVSAIWRQLCQPNTADFSCEKSPDIRPFLVGGVVPDGVKNALVRIMRTGLGMKLDGPDPINGCWLVKRRIKFFKVQGTMNVKALPVTLNA